MFIALIWKFDFAPFMVLIIAILNDGEMIFIRLLHQYVLLYKSPGQTHHGLESDLFCHHIYRYNHDNFEGQSKAISTARQLETQGDFRYWHCAWRLLSTDDCGILLGNDRHQFLLSKNSFCYVSFMYYFGEISFDFSKFAFLYFRTSLMLDL